MTNPRHLPQFGTWSVPNCPLAIEYDLEILETIRREVTAGFQAPRGGVEVGGLLVGTYDGKRVRITGFSPVRCNHELGPKFILDGNETAALDQQLLAHNSRGQPNREAVVGWYQSHLRRGLTLSSEDVQIYERHFPEPWQVALLLRPDPAGGIHARFFLREPAPDKRTPARSSSQKGGSAKLPGDSERISPAGKEVQDPPHNPPADAKRGLQNKTVWTVLAAMFVLAVGSVFYMRFNFAITPFSHQLLHLEAVTRNNSIELRWDPKELAVASRGRLEIRDGASVREIALDREILASGRFLYRQQSDVIGFRLQADQSRGAALEGSAMYVARTVDSANVAQVSPSPLPADTPTSHSPSPVAAAPPPPAPPAVQSDMGKTRADAIRLTSPLVTPLATTTVSRPVELPKTATPAPAVTPAPKQDEPQKPKTEPVQAAAPVQIAQLQRPNVPELPAPLQNPPLRVETPPATPLSRVIPKEATPPPAPTPVPQWRLEGRWILQSGGYSRSPAVPEAVFITVRETDGAVQGTLDARYKSRSKADRVHFSFSGKMVNGAARFSWTSTGGQRGQIEFIRVANSPDVAEVVWQNPENKHVFDEMLRRAN